MSAAWLAGSPPAQWREGCNLVPCADRGVWAVPSDLVDEKLQSIWAWPGFEEVGNQFVVGHARLLIWQSVSRQAIEIAGGCQLWFVRR